jgi:hypothetical protein
VTLAADTVVHIVLAEAVSSNGRKRGDKFAIKLAAPIVVDGRTLVPAGATGQGEVVDAQHAGFGGAPGKLVVAARYIDAGAVRIRLKALNVGSAGDSKFVEAMVAAEFIGLPALLIHGGEVLYPPGTPGHAKVAEAILLPAGPQVDDKPNPPSNPEAASAPATAAPASAAKPSSPPSPPTPHVNSSPETPK